MNGKHGTYAPSHPPGAAAVAVGDPAQWLHFAAESTKLADFWRLVGATLRISGAPCEAGLVRGAGGSWQPLVPAVAPPVMAAGAAPSPIALAPLLAEAADQEQPVLEPPHLVVPLRIEELPGTLLVMTSAKAADIAATSAWRDGLSAVMNSLAEAVRVVWLRQQTLEQNMWLQGVLAGAEKWNQARGADERIYHIERTVAQLLNCKFAFLVFATDGGQPTFRRQTPGGDASLDSSPDAAGWRDAAGWHDVVARGEIYLGDVRSAAADLAAGGILWDTDPPESTMIVPLIGRHNEAFAALLCLDSRADAFDALAVDRALQLARHVAPTLLQVPTDRPFGQKPRSAETDGEPLVRLIGQSDSIQELRATTRRVAQTDLPVLVMGENGTGKEVVCRMIHAGSARADMPFLAVNCAAISESLLESELFGHEKGAFTDAGRTRAGKFELAHRGTLFLDEIGDMSTTGQAKLLRVLEEKTIVRVGGSEPIEADVRVLAATNKDLAQLVRDRQFREDLFFRLNVVTLRIPPLRARGRDVLLLAEHFLEQFSQRVERPTPTLSAEAQRRLLHHAWPGNVRELRNLMERVVFLATEETVDETILTAILPERSEQPVGALDLPLNEATREFQIEYITRHIEAARGNMSEAARQLGLHRSNLYRKLNQLGLSEGES